MTTWRRGRYRVTHSIETEYGKPTRLIKVRVERESRGGAKALIATVPVDAPVRSYGEAEDVSWFYVSVAIREDKKKAWWRFK